MNVNRSRIMIAAACGVFVAAAAGGCGHQAEGTASSAPLSATEQAKAAEQARQAEIRARTAQINRSGLPPDQKQRLLEQVRATSEKKQLQ